VRAVRRCARVTGAIIAAAMERARLKAAGNQDKN